MAHLPREFGRNLPTAEISDPRPDVEQVIPQFWKRACHADTMIQHVLRRVNNEAMRDLLYHHLLPPMNPLRIRRLLRLQPAIDCSQG